MNAFEKVREFFDQVKDVPEATCDVYDRTGRVSMVQRYADYKVYLSLVGRNYMESVIGIVVFESADDLVPNKSYVACASTVNEVLNQLQSRWHLNLGIILANSDRAFI